MLQHHTSQVTVRDPICGMELDPAQAFATRTQGEETFYFCSQRCLQQFDREHTTSATTGVSTIGKLYSIDLAVASLEGHHGAKYLEEQIEKLAGIERVTANVTTKLVHIVYDPALVQVITLVNQIRQAGYTMGTATLHLAISGMHCASCVVTLEQALQRTKGVLTANVNLAAQQAHIEYLPSLIDRSGLIRAVEEAGYQVREVAPAAPATLDRSEQEQTHEYKMLLRKFWFAAAISFFHG